jgi:hypothetical protein
MVATPDVILWQNENGQASLWEMNGDGSIGGVQLPLNQEDPHPGQAVGIDSIVGGGLQSNDILWQNQNGQASIFLLFNGDVVTEQLVNPNPGPSWKAVGAGDFNDDNHADILWQNANGQLSIWEMAGNTVTGGGAVAIAGQTTSLNPGPAWKAIGTGDFNDDGQSDILFQNASTGQVSIWEMSENHLIGGGPVSPNPGPTWKAIGTGDFDHDGFSDILFQNKLSGQVSIWEMNGNTLVGGGTVETAGGISLNPGPSTHAIGTDGGSDILFQNTNGQASIWDMSGNTLVGGGPVGPNPGPTWRAVGLSTF